MTIMQVKIDMQEKETGMLLNKYCFDSTKQHVKSLNRLFFVSLLIKSSEIGMTSFSFSNKLIDLMSQLKKKIKAESNILVICLN